ncbi:exonuclease subunit SbcD [soil metagenome]
MTRLAVTADLHVSDYGQRVDPATGVNARFADAVGIVRWIARDARERGCDALIVAGDVTEERHPSPWRVALIQDALADFVKPHILVRGNHDGLRAGRSVVDVLAAGLSGAQYGFSRPGIAWVKGTAVCALPYLDRHYLRSQPGFDDVPDADVYRVLGEQFLAMARGLFAQAHVEHPDLDDAVLVVHQGLAGGHMSEAQQAFLGDLSLVVDTAALGAIGFDAVLAGHFHRHQVLHRDPLVVYAGSPHRVSFGEADDPKGYLVVDTADPGAFEFVETPARRFVTLDYAAAGEDLGAMIMGGIEDAIVRVINAPPDVPADDVVKALELAGTWDVTEVRRAPVETPASAGGMSESLSAEQALEVHFADDPDREALVERGRAVLAEVA